MSLPPAVAPADAYRHTQHSPALVAILLAAGAIPAMTLLLAPRHALALGPRLTLAAAALTILVSAVAFSSLTVAVGGGRLSWHFGRGVLRKTVPIAAIAGADATATNFMEGWGIHLTRRGWLYNVSGRGAVLVTMRDGKRFMLGSDEPDELVRAIRAAQGARGAGEV